MQTILYGISQGNLRSIKKKRLNENWYSERRFTSVSKGYSRRSYSITFTKIGITVLAENRKRIRFSISFRSNVWMGLPFSGYVEEARMRLFTNYVFGNQNMANTQLGEGGGGGRGGRNNIHWPIRERHRSFSLLRHDLASVMTNRREWDRLIK